MANEIKGFGGDYHFLSNFYEAPVAYEGITYPTSEHAFQAAKFFTEFDTVLNDVRSGILTMETPGQAKRWGKKIPLRSDWEDVKYQIMYEIVLAKFTQNPDLKEKLLNTGDAYLEETNNWNDKVWGVCNGIGKNWLGKILMNVRNALLLSNV